MKSKIQKFIRKIFYYPKAIERKIALRLARKYLLGNDCWTALEELGVPGFGINLMRVDFPPKFKSRPRFGFGTKLHPELKGIMNLNNKLQESLLNQVLDRSKKIFSWPKKEDKKNPFLPWIENAFLPVCDMAVLYGLINLFRPRRFIEVGSGLSTRVAFQAKKDSKNPMDIISIDPEPRVGIDKLCNKIIKKRLEDTPLRHLIKMTGNGTVFSFDGSHRSFPSSDVTVFFLEILPRLKRGTLVHIHDIYLPADYSKEASERFWSEQYLLAAYLLGGGAKIKILLPCFYFCTKKSSRSLLEKKLGKKNSIGYSFWMEIV